jgi:hypothetical protein
VVVEFSLAQQLLLPPFRLTAARTSWLFLLPALLGLSLTHHPAKPTNEEACTDR